jgi:hypothetical protein
MKRRRLASAVAAAIAVPALGLGLNGAASARTISPGFYAKQIVVLDCQGHPHVRPGHYTLACADGNDYLSGLAWTSWGPRLASATGTEHVNDCVPYCAAGHFHSYPVNVVLWGSDAVPMNAGPGNSWHRELHRSDTPVSPELTFSFASGHAGFG